MRAILTDNTHGYDDFDIIDAAGIRRVKVPHTIRINERFNVYYGCSTKECMIWNGDVIKSIESSALYASLSKARSIATLAATLATGANGRGNFHVSDDDGDYDRFLDSLNDLLHARLAELPGDEAADLVLLGRAFEDVPKDKLAATQAIAGEVLGRLVQPGISIPFRLGNTEGESGNALDMHVHFCELGVGLGADGYRTCNSDDSVKDGIVWSYFHENEWNLSVFSDVNREDPAIAVSMDQARYSASLWSIDGQW